MSSRDAAVAVRGLGKRYTVARPADRPATLAGAVAGALRGPRRDAFWALADVSFEVAAGEVVGVVGRNGAGKSTLLKLLSRVAEPTAGEIDLYGRVGSLLEVGTGFHPELTGRENVYLNGAILGMTRAEVRRKFDEIVEFAGVGKFLDTPVKRYSSGMYVRLAFAVAAHLDPDVLILDEVLAVGDAEFQQKCLGKMGEASRAGRAVLLVSHNMGSVQAFCSRVLVVDAGRLAFDGPPADGVALYLTKLQPGGPGAAGDPDRRPGDGSVRVTAVRLRAASGDEAGVVVGGRDVALELEYEARRPGVRPDLLVNVYNDAGVAVTAAHTRLTRPDLPPVGRRGRFVCRMPRLPLAAGGYRVSVAVHVGGGTADYLPLAATFDVAGSEFYPTGAAPDARAAAFLLDHAWDHVPDPEPAPPGSRPDQVTHG